MACSHFRVAVVDDDESVRKALARLLRASGYEVEVFVGGGEFLDSLKAGKSDCVVLDVHMPMVSGLSVQEMLRASGEYVPIIFMTAYDDDTLREEALAKGAVAYLRKPLTEKTLLTAIAKVANTKN
jgi:FixJ family two-component response regulator